MATSTELTRKNSDYIFQLEKLLKASGKYAETEIAQLLAPVEEQLLIGQSSGKTAQQLYGPVTQAAQKLVMPAPKPALLHEYSWLTLSGDTILVLMVLLMGMNAVMLMGTKTINEGTMGITSLLLITILGGLAYTFAIYKLTPNPDQPRRGGRASLRVIGLLVGVIAVWLAGFTLLAMLPRTINPVMPPIFAAAIAVISYFGLRFYRKWQKLPKGFFVTTTLANNTRLAARQTTKK